MTAGFLSRKAGVGATISVSPGGKYDNLLGLTTHHIEIFQRENSIQPMWPIDELADYSPDA